jgi:hypothetical protein
MTSRTKAHDKTIRLGLFMIVSIIYLDGNCFKPGPGPSAEYPRYTASIPITSADGHWCHIVKYVFKAKDGVATLENVLIIACDPRRLGSPTAMIRAPRRFGLRLKEKAVSWHCV